MELYVVWKEEIRVAVLLMRFKWGYKTWTMFSIPLSCRSPYEILYLTTN